jgi:pimeloyl-ACP methyl ester carboxylesterase
MEKVTSPDGTRIAYYRGGAGSPLILVHGTGAASTRWTPLFPALEEHFSVVAVDRRGRGESGDGNTYAIQREFEDVAAVADAIGEPAHVLGHSFGGLCALEAGLLTRNVGKLVLYETPIPLPGVPLYPEGVIDRLQALLDAGDREGVLTRFIHEVVGMPPHEFALFRSSPAWPVRLAAAHTLPREMRALERYQFDAPRFKALHTPTLLLLGGDSPHFFKAASEAVDTALPNSRIAVMPGQRHIAMDTAPDLFLHEVLTFLIGGNNS